MTVSSENHDRLWGLLPAAGVGRRMGGDVPKQYLPLAGSTVIEHSLRRLASVSGLSSIVVVVAPDDALWSQMDIAVGAPVYPVSGGAERCHSVLNGLDRLAELGKDSDWVLVHDAARPCVRLADIETMVRELKDHPVGGLLGLPVADTVKRADAVGNVIETVDRSGLWRALTPQMFRIGPLRASLRRALDRGDLVTDESSAMELAGEAPRMVAGHPDNIKITHPQDLALAARYLAQQESNS